MLTEVHLISWPPEKVDRIVFGRTFEERDRNANHRIVTFEPGEVFAVSRWRRGPEGDVRIDIIRAARPGEPFTGAYCVSPGGEILAHAEGPRNVETALAAIESVRVFTRPELAAPDYWRHVGDRLSAGLRPRAYSMLRHQAWIMRKRVRW